MQKYWEEHKVILEDMNSKLVPPDVVFQQKTATVIAALKQFPDMPRAEVMYIQLHILQNPTVCESFLQGDLEDRDVLVQMISSKQL